MVRRKDPEGTAGARGESDARNEPSQVAGGASQGAREGAQAGMQSRRTGMADAEPGDDARERGGVASSQGLTGAQGSGGGAERGVNEAPPPRPRQGS